MDDSAKTVDCAADYAADAKDIASSLDRHSESLGKHGSDISALKLTSASTSARTEEQIKTIFGVTAEIKATQTVIVAKQVSHGEELKSTKSVIKFGVIIVTAVVPIAVMVLQITASWFMGK